MGASGFSLEDLVAAGVQHVRHGLGKQVDEDAPVPEARAIAARMGEAARPMVAVPVVKTHPTGLQRAQTAPTAVAQGKATLEQILARQIRIEKKLDWLINTLRAP